MPDKLYSYVISNFMERVDRRKILVHCPFVSKILSPKLILGRGALQLPVIGLDTL